MHVMKVSSQLGCSFADHLQVMNDPDLDEFILLKGFSPSDSVPFNASDGVQDIPKPLLWISHSGTASRKTRSRIGQQS